MFRAISHATLIGLLLVPSAVLAQEAGSEELPPGGTPLAAGRYHSEAVGPRIEFRVGDGWVAGPTGAGPIFTLERSDEPGTVLTVTRFDGAAFVESCDSTSLTDVDVSVPRLVEIIAGNPFLNPSPPRIIDVDGHTGFVLDVATPQFEECALPFLLLWALPMVDGEFVQVAGQQSRFIVVDVEGEVIVIAIESFPGVPFGGLLDASMDLVDSMRIDAAPLPEPTSTTGPGASPDPRPSPAPADVGPSA